MGTELPAGFDYPIAPRAVTFQAMAAFGTAQKRLLYITAAPRALFFSVVSPTQEKDDNSDGQQGKEQNPEKGAVIEITAMPCISPGARHCVYLG